MEVMLGIFAIIMIAAIALISYILVSWKEEKRKRAENLDAANKPYETYISRTLSTQAHDFNNNIPNQNIVYGYYPYRQKPLLTQTEYAFWINLKQQCDRYGLIICPKVRMEDFINVTVQQNKLRYRGYIKSRHIDFMICDGRLNLMAGLELDDRSHQRPDVAQTDRFKDEVFRTIGLPLYRVRTSQGAYGVQIEQIISHMMACQAFRTHSNIGEGTC